MLPSMRLSIHIKVENNVNADERKCIYPCVCVNMCLCVIHCIVYVDMVENQSEISYYMDYFAIYRNSWTVTLM